MPYLSFLLERAGAPPPKSILILQHQEEWASRQIADEACNCWPEAQIRFAPQPSNQDSTREPPSNGGASFRVKNHLSAPSCELLIIPFDGDTPAVLDSRTLLGDAAWVVLYGLEERRVWALRADAARKFLSTARRLRLLRRFLAISKLARPAKEGIKIWKWLHRI